MDKSLVVIGFLITAVAIPLPAEAQKVEAAKAALKLLFGVAKTESKLATRKTLTNSAKAIAHEEPEVQKIAKEHAPEAVKYGLECNLIKDEYESRKCFANKRLREAAGIPRASVRSAASKHMNPTLAPSNNVR